MSLRARLGLALVSLVVAAAVWLPLVHRFHGAEWVDATRAGPPPPKVRALAARQLALWADPAARRAENERMARTNPEWGFMGRSFFAWSLANLALREPAREGEALAALDRVIEDTLAVESEQGMYAFLMPYARRAPFVVQPPRSVFVDGEIALMMGLRRLVREHAPYRADFAARLDTMAARMSANPVRSAESYPDECWTFCNTVALAAMRVGDALDGTDHAPLAREWVAAAKAHLVEERTGLLVSSYHLDGRWKDGPEGSSIWMAIHDLVIVDEDFARDQYARAKRELLRRPLGFAYAREWPAGHGGAIDVDSGPVIPLLDASAGSSGLALVGSAAAGDRDTLRALVSTLDLAAFPIERGGELRYAASNQVGDAVLLYALTLGPAWERVQQRLAERRR